LNIQHGSTTDSYHALLLLLFLLDNMKPGGWLPTFQGNIVTPISKGLENEAIRHTETVTNMS